MDSKQFAQNKISYIVYHNPKEVKQLIYDYGYHVPKGIHQVVAATKQLVKKEKGFIKDLLDLHPEKELFLSLIDEKEDSFCGQCGEVSYDGGCGCSNYDTPADLSSFQSAISKLDTTELEVLYDQTLKEANANPGNSKLADEVQQIWGELRLRKITEKKKEESKDKESTGLVSSQGLTIAVAVISGILIGLTIKS